MRDKDTLQWAEENLNRRIMHKRFKSELLREYQKLLNEISQILRVYDQIMEKF